MVEYSCDIDLRHSIQYDDKQNIYKLYPVAFTLFNVTWLVKP